MARLRSVNVLGCLLPFMLLAVLSACRTAVPLVCREDDPLSVPYAVERSISWESLRTDAGLYKEQYGYVEGILQIEIANGCQLGFVLWEHTEAMVRGMSRRRIRLNPEDTVRALETQGIKSNDYLKVSGTLATVCGRLLKLGEYDLGVFQSVDDVEVHERARAAYEEWRKSLKSGKGHEAGL